MLAKFLTYSKKPFLFSQILNKEKMKKLFGAVFIGTILATEKIAFVDNGS